MSRRAGIHSPHGDDVDGAKTPPRVLAEGLLPIADGFMSLRDAMQTQMEAAVTNNLTWEEYLQTLGVAGQIAVLDPLFGNLAQKQISTQTPRAEQGSARLLNAVTSADYVTQAWAENVFMPRKPWICKPRTRIKPM